MSIISPANGWTYQRANDIGLTVWEAFATRWGDGSAFGTARLPPVVANVPPLASGWILNSAFALAIGPRSTIDRISFTYPIYTAPEFGNTGNWVDSPSLLMLGVGTSHIGNAHKYEVPGPIIVTPRTTYIAGTQIYYPSGGAPGIIPFVAGDGLPQSTLPGLVEAGALHLQLFIGDNPVGRLPIKRDPMVRSIQAVVNIPAAAAETLWAGYPVMGRKRATFVARIITTNNNRAITVRFGGIVRVSDSDFGGGPLWIERTLATQVGALANVPLEAEIALNGQYDYLMVYVSAPAGADIDTLASTMTATDEDAG